MHTRKITIVARGETDEDLDDAVAEALRRIDGGFTSGSDRGESGGFYFTVTDDVPEDERPA